MGNGHICVEDADGIVVASFDIVNGHATICLNQDYYLLTVKTEQKFDYIDFVLINMNKLSE
ncbi:MAG: hypothetical protein K2N34_01105 [Lachnospiraceae bacterium]|nr:hypothetical protein [Lachnospiraceae bacterium]